MVENAHFIPFSAPDVGAEEEAQVIDTLRSGWLSSGAKVLQLETAFANFLGVCPSRAVAVSSATAGLHLALEAVGVGPGDEVITCTHTFTATAEAIRYLGARPVLVDVDSVTLCMDPLHVARRITSRTRALIVVHFAGRSADMTSLLALARTHQLAVVEDAAHALPTTHDSRLVGTLDSDATVFSFYANKTMTTGEGGMVMVREPENARRMRSLRLHGIDHDAFNRRLRGQQAWRYDVIAPGYKYNMSDISAALGLAQLEKLQRMHARRQAIALHYFDRLAGLPLSLPPLAAPGDVHAWHLFVIQMHDGLERDEFIENLHGDGVGAGVHYVPLHRMSYWREQYSLCAKEFPVSDAAFQRSVSLPMYSRLDDDSVERVVASVKRALEKGRRLRQARACMM